MPGRGSVPVDVSVAQKEVKTYTLTPGNPLSARVHIEHCLEMGYASDAAAAALKVAGTAAGGGASGAPASVQATVAACMAALERDCASAAGAKAHDGRSKTASKSALDSTDESPVGPWRTLIHTQSDMWSTPTEFVLRNRVLAWEATGVVDGADVNGAGGDHSSSDVGSRAVTGASGRRLVFDIVDEKRVPRRGV